MELKLIARIDTSKAIDWEIRIELKLLLDLDQKLSFEEVVGSKVKNRERFKKTRAENPKSDGVGSTVGFC